MYSHVLKLGLLNSKYGIVYASECDMNAKLRTQNCPFLDNNN